MGTPEWVPTHLGDGYELTALYGQFWARIQRLVGKPVRPKRLDAKPQVETDGESLRFDFGRAGDILLLRGLPCLNAPGTAAFDVYLSGYQIVRRVKVGEGDPFWVTVTSEFDVLFLNALDESLIRRAWEVSQRVSNAYAGYRFSISVHDVEKHAPDCRARYSLEAIKPERIQRLYKEDDDGWKARSMHGQPSIPSAPLDLIGILYVLLHEHASKSVANGWPWDMRELLAQLPTVNLGVDVRSHARGWYDHSHLAKEPQPLRRQPDGFNLPLELSEAGWSARIAGRERLETPHVTVNRGEDRSRRVNIRKRNGAMLEGENDIPHALWVELVRTLPAWRKLWESHYPNQPVGQLED